MLTNDCFHSYQKDRGHKVDSIKVKLRTQAGRPPDGILQIINFKAENSMRAPSGPRLNSAQAGYEIPARKNDVKELF